MNTNTIITEEFSSLTVEEIQLEERIIAGIFWILYTIPGNALMFGIVQFDRLGGDPLKRRITDQVPFQMICLFETKQLLICFM